MPARLSVMVVCTGNICRSPMAEASFRLEAERARLAVTVDSAGTGGWHVGEAPDRRAQAVARRNGVEIGGGSMRIYEPPLQEKMFEALGITSEAQQAQFGHLLRALRLGAPPHGGIAFGFDRLVMLICGEQSIREVMAFPKNNRAMDLMSQSPSEVDPKQLRDLGIRLASNNKRE